MSIAQVLVSGGVLFFLYRYLLQTIGPEKLGIWAVVLATASASRISEMGFSGSAVKFTARYIARGDIEESSQVIQTTLVTIGVVLGSVLVAIYPFVVWVLETVVPTTDRLTALAITPYVLASVWIGSIAGVTLSGLDGCQRIDLRALLVMLAGVTLLGLTWLLTPRYGLIGLAWSQIAQGGFLLIASWILLRREIPGLPILPFRWRLSLFREMLSYGVNFQIISIASLLFEPTTKALLAKFGGLTLTAYYEMANRLVVQCRALLVSANQAVVPRVATLQEISPAQIQSLYVETYRVVFYLALPLYATVAAAAPLISDLWIGRYEDAFVLFTLLLVLGFWLNTLVGPAYFVSLGTGSLRWNTWGHVTIGILNAILGLLLGFAFGGVGVVVGYVLALVAGSTVVVIGHHHDNHISPSVLWPSESTRLFVACSLALLIGWALVHFLASPERFLMIATLSLVTCVLVLLPAFWIHPLRASLIHKVIVAT